MTLDYLYEMCRRDSLAHGSVYGQVWHEADIDGFHLYIADTSFGDGPMFRITGPGTHYAWENPGGEWSPLFVGQPAEVPVWVLDLAQKATWKFRLNLLDPPGVQFPPNP